MRSSPATPLEVDLDERKIDAIFSELNQSRLPGAGVGIAHQGRAVYRRGFGLASMELPVVLSPTIRMRIGSTTKHFAALTYLLLCEEGKAGIEDPIGKYLPELHPANHRVTARQLMSNTSGLRDALDIAWQFCGTGGAVSSCELLSLYHQVDDANAPPGAHWIYNNGGWLLLSAAIERIAGKSLEAVMRERIFEPVGMHDTLLRRSDTDFVPNSATLHTMNPAGGYGRFYLGTALAGEGGMVSTVDDMLRWLAHMDAPVVGSAATWEAMKTPQKLMNGTSTGYGLGLMRGVYRGLQTLGHGGGVMGGNSEMIKVPAAGLDIAIHVNRGDVSAALLAREVLDACVPELTPVKQEAAKAPITGVFRSPVSGRVIQLFGTNPRVGQVDGQQVVSVDGLDMPVLVDEKGVMRPAGMWQFLEQSVACLDGPERPTIIRFNDFGNIDELYAVNPSEGSELSTVRGRYRSPSTHIEATIHGDTGMPTLKTTGRFGSTESRLESIAEGVWRSRPTLDFPPGGVLSFSEDASRLTFSSFRTRALPFERVD